MYSSQNIKKLLELRERGIQMNQVSCWNQWNVRLLGAPICSGLDWRCERSVWKEALVVSETPGPGINLRLQSLSLRNENSDPPRGWAPFSVNRFMKRCLLLFMLVACSGSQPYFAREQRLTESCPELSTACIMFLYIKKIFCFREKKKGLILRSDNKIRWPLDTE